ncbi:uncharacterized protein SEPMUDRAFT_50206, partial [Sphaerulina musiva SO2202]
EILLDNAKYNLGEVEALLRKYGVARLRILLYYPESIAIVEVRYKPIITALSKITDRGKIS